MATTSTVPAVLDSLISAFSTALPGTIATFEAWPGPDAAPEMVVLGEILWDDYVIATIKGGRKHRQEEWSVGFEVFVMGTAGSTPADPSNARDRAFTLLSSLEDVLANDPRNALGNTVQWIEVKPTEAGPRVLEKAWAYRVAGRIHTHARLT